MCLHFFKTESDENVRRWTVKRVCAFYMMLSNLSILQMKVSKQLHSASKILLNFKEIAGEYHFFDFKDSRVKDTTICMISLSNSLLVAIGNQAYIAFFLLLILWFQGLI